MKTFKVPFAFDNEGNVVDIETAQKGIIYKCSCGADVKVRGGDVISNHFYHPDESVCSLESSIHKAYKSVFQQNKKIKLPNKINDVQYLEFDRVELEKKIDDYIPDAIGYIGEDMYLIEFAKSSYIGERKEAKIKKSNLFCLEIDIIKTIKTLSEIANHLENEKFHKHIIHVPEYKEMAELKEKYRIEYNKLKYKHGEERKELYNEMTQLKHKLEVFEDFAKNDDVFELQNKLQIFDELHKGGSMFFKTLCKNGAKMYERRFDGGRWGSKVIAFQNDSRITLKFEI